MSLWFSQTGRRKSDTGKFRSRVRFGTEKSPGGRHRGWSYHFVSHHTGTIVRRTIYSVAISDPHQNRLAYLRNFSSVEQAATAAREWIDCRLSRIWPKSSAGAVGTIPALPGQESSDQEK
ncbi:MAG: hypothetical protein IH898_01965 [Planctomycetes bacterium]|nr:hypothetical protein [Planctomycetota bacterium]